MTKKKAKKAPAKKAEPAKFVPPVVKKLANYRNTSKKNIFTESGKCRPGAKISLMPDQAEKYKGLEQCPS